MSSDGPCSLYANDGLFPVDGSVLEHYLGVPCPETFAPIQWSNMIHGVGPCSCTTIYSNRSHLESDEAIHGDGPNRCQCLMIGRAILQTLD